MQRFFYHMEAGLSLPIYFTDSFCMYKYMSMYIYIQIYTNNIILHLAFPLNTHKAISFCWKATWHCILNVFADGHTGGFQSFAMDTFIFTIHTCVNTPIGYIFRKGHQLYILVDNLFRFPSFLCNTLSLFHYISCFLRLLLAVAISQPSLVFDDLDSFQEHWLGIL